MKQKIIKTLKIGGIFMGGLIVGAVLMNLLHIYVRPEYREVLRMELQTKQSFLASRAARQNDNLKAVLYRWNVVELDSGESFQDLRTEKKEELNSFLLPFLLLPAKYITTYYKNCSGEYALQGINHGYLAAALDAIGENEEATRQWEQSQKMIKLKSLEETRKFISSLLEQENTDLHMQAEKKILEN